MQPDASTSRLFALCPPWLWPVLAISLVALRARLCQLEALGAAGWEIRLSGWGRAYVSRVWWPDAARDWKDALYRNAMGEPEAAPAWRPAPLGISTDETSADWASGAGWYGFVPDAVGWIERSEIHHRCLHHGLNGGFRVALSTLQSRAPP